MLKDRGRETEGRGPLTEAETRHWGARPISAWTGQRLGLQGPPGVAGLEGQHGRLVCLGTVSALWVPLGGRRQAQRHCPTGPRGPPALATPGELSRRKYQPSLPESQTSLCEGEQSYLLPIRGSNHHALRDGMDSSCGIPGNGQTSGRTVVFSK